LCVDVAGYEGIGVGRGTLDMESGTQDVWDVGRETGDVCLKTLARACVMTSPSGAVVEKFCVMNLVVGRGGLDVGRGTMTWGTGAVEWPGWLEMEVGFMVEMRVMRYVWLLWGE
jgi:hypothetical protein